MTIYDGHMHIGGSAEPNPAKLMARLEKCGISGGNVISIDPDDVNFTYEQRVENMFAWVRGYEDRLFPVAWLHPDEEDILDKVRDLAARGVAAFKFIPNNYSVRDDMPTKVFQCIEELGLPIIFHSGILYDFLESSQYNKPSDWECFIRYKNIRFSMGHCAYPWYDEAIAVYGKFRWIHYHTQRAAQHLPTIYYNNPWVVKHLHETESGIEYEVPQLYLDTTAGAHKAYRRDMLIKFATNYPDGENIFFGTDQYVEDYPSEIVAERLAEEKAYLDEANASQAFRQKMYCDNLFRFMNLKCQVG